MYLLGPGEQSAAMGRVELSKVFPVVLAGEEGGLRGPTQDAGGECAEQSDIRLCKFKS